MAESFKNSFWFRRRKNRKTISKILSLSFKPITTDTLGERLSADEWLVQNTLPLILPLLDASDVLNCRKVCKLWKRIITSGERLSKDEWLVHNTLPFILPYLEVPDALHCSQVCKLWQQVIKESTVWNSIALSRYSLNLDKMVTFLYSFGTKHLRMRDCDFPNLTDNRSRNLFESKCMKRTEHLLDLCEWEAFQVCVDILPRSKRLNVSVRRSSTGFTREPQPSRSRCVPDIKALQPLVMTTLYSIQRGYSCIEPPPACISDSDTQTFCLNQCCNLRSVIMLHLDQPRPLKYFSFLICEFPRFNLVKTISDLRFLTNLYYLHLLEIYIEDGFENALKLCTHLEDFRIAPLLREKYVGRDNGRILHGVRELNLKSFVWIFSDQYVWHCNELIADEMAEFVQADFEPDFIVPFIGDADSLNDDLKQPEQAFPSFRLITGCDLQEELQALLVKCDVLVINSPVY
ncbi:uncharacterized protein [Euwallacea similis]|uniref:uncharacterized protein n=1 Tax=Euwallacea similis TaxID=1736056 RepID=UPI00344CAB34